MATTNDLINAATVNAIPDDFHAIAKMLNEQCGTSSLMQGYGNQAKGGLTTATGMQMLQAQQNAAMRNQMDMMNRTVTGVEMNDPKKMCFTLREISNGYMVEVNNDETYVKDLNDVGGVVVARWAAKLLGEKT